MEIRVHLPDDLAQRPNPGREALESLAIEGYKTGVLSHFQASQMLGFSRIEFDGFLKEKQIYDHAYGVEEFEKDWQAIEGDLRRRIEKYTVWLRECPGAADLSITPTEDKGAYPYQWKIEAVKDSAHLIGYLTLDGPAIGVSDAEKRQALCERLQGALQEAREAGRLS